MGLKNDNTCIYWGDISRNASLFNIDISQFTNIKTIVYSKDVMVGLKYDGGIVGLGELAKGANVPDKLEKDVERIFATTTNGFSALTIDNRIYSWGEDSSYEYSETNALAISVSSSSSTQTTQSSSTSGSSSGTSSGSNTTSSSSGSSGSSGSSSYNY